MEGSEQKQETRKRRRTRSKGSQTQENDEIGSEECCVGCREMANTLNEINKKLDMALERIKEIDELREKQAALEKENRMLKESVCISCFIRENR